jgi:predicted nucleic acid-binding protein
VTEKVIDSSALAKFLLKEEGWRDLRNVVLEKPYTLDLSIKEVANALWRRVAFIGM